MKTFECSVCGKSFALSYRLRRHERSVHGEKEFLCSKCPRTFARKDYMEKHLKSHESDRPCPLCGKMERSNAALSRHMQEHLQQPQPSTSHQEEDPNVYKEKALKGGVRNYKYELPDGETDFEEAQRSYKERLLKLLRRMLAEGPIKWYYASKIRFCKQDDPDDVAVQCFRSRFVTVLQEHELEPQLDDAFIQAQQHCMAFEKKGSGWVIESILTMELNIAQYKPISGSTYVPLPRYAQTKKAVVNIQNNDNLCFAYSVLAALHPVYWKDQPHRVSHYTGYMSELNLQGLEFPLPIHQVEKFEKQNDISVNVIGYEDKEFFPLHVSKYRTERQVDLLFISMGEIQHYCLIRSLSRLLGDTTKHCREAFYCHYCLHRFSSQRTLDEHRTLCEGHEPQKVEMPTDKWLKFTKVEHQMSVPFTVYADFECVLVPVSTCLPDPAITSTTTQNIHVPCGYAIAIVEASGKYRRY